MKKMYFFLSLCLAMIGLTANAQIASLSELSNEKCYAVSNARTSWATSATALKTIKDLGVAADETSPAQQFAFVTNDEGATYYLYSVGQSKFVNLDGSLGNKPVNPINFKQSGSKFVMYFDASHYINCGGSSQMIIDGWNIADEGNMCDIKAVADFDPTAALAAFNAVDEAEVAANLEAAEAALAKAGVGYPTADCGTRTALVAAVDAAKAQVTAETASALSAALKAFLAETNVTLPETGKYYTFTMVAKNGNKFYLNYTGTDVAMTPVTGEELPESAKFLATANGDGTYTFQTSDGNYLVYHTKYAGVNWLEGGGNTTGFQAEKDDMTNITLAKLSAAATNVAATDAQVFGLVSWYGKRGYDTGKNENAMGYMVLKTDGTDFDGANAPFWNDNYSSAFLVEETEVAAVEPVLPLELVSIEPADGAKITEFNTVTFTFNKPVKLVESDETGVLLMYNGMPAGQLWGEVSEDGKTAVLSMGMAVNMEGTYTVYAMEGAFEDLDGNKSAEMTATYTLAGAADGFTYTYAAPTTDKVQSSLKNITLGFASAVATVKTDALNVVDGEGNVVTTATVAADDMDDQAVVVTLAEEVVYTGTYSITVPAEFVTSTMGTYNPEFTLTYTVEGQEKPTTPAVTEAELKLTFVRNGNDVTVNVAGLEGVTASVVAKSHDWKDLGIANASTVLCPNVNGNTDPTITWALELKGVPANLNLKGMGLDIHALNGGGQYQDPADNVARHWNIVVAQGDAEVANFNDIEISQGTEEGRTMNNNHKVHALEVEGPAATDPMTLNFTVTKGSENKGCFFGLSEITLSYAAEATPEVPATPLELVSIEPADGAKITEFNTVTFTFNKPVKLVESDETGVLLMYNGMPAGQLWGEVSEDGKTAVLSMGMAVNMEGTYTVYAMEGAFEDLDGNKSAEMTATYTLAGAADGFTYTYAAPTTDKVQSSLKNITLGFASAVATVKTDALNVVDAEGNVVTTATVAADDMDDQAVVVTLAEEVVYTGTYSLTVPAQFVTSTMGTYNPEFTLTYTVEGLEKPFTPVVITDVAQLSNAKCYTLVSSDTGRGGMYALADKVDMCGVTYNQAQECHGVARDNNDPKQQFAFVAYEGKHYLYSVSEKKFVMKSGDTNALVGEAPFEFVTVEPVSEGKFALKANDTHYFTASPGWCANPSRGTCIQSTLTSHSTDDGWDDGAWFTITEVGNFDATEALAMLTPAPVVPTTVESVDPACGNYEVMPSTITVKFSQEVSAITYSRIRTDVGTDAYTLKAEDLQLNGKEVTFTVPTEFVDGARTMLIMLAVEDVNGNPVSYSSNEETEIEGYVMLEYTAESKPAATPLELVSVDPADGSELSSAYKFTFTFNKPVTVSEEGSVTLSANGGTTTLEAVPTEGDGSVVTFTTGKEITVSGDYVLNVAAGTFVDADGNANEAMTFNYVVKSEAKLVLVKTNPSEDEVQTSLNEITLSFDQPVYYYDDVTINVTDENGNVVTTAYIDYGWEYEDMMVILNQEITAPGKYTVTVPAGCLFGYGSSNAEIVLTYTVEDPTGINRLFVENKNDVYTLDGRKVVVMPGQKIKKGLYIVGGKKVYVK